MAASLCALRAAAAHRKQRACLQPVQPRLPAAAAPRPPRSHVSVSQRAPLLRAPRFFAPKELGASASRGIVRPAQRTRAVTVSAATLDGSASLLPSSGSGSSLGAVLQFCRAFVRFTRPHTMIGTVLSIVSVSLMALSGPADFTITTLLGVLQAIVPALFMNVCIVGFNQLCDVDIDKVNKPYLPLASGDFSVALGQTLVVLCGAISLALGYVANSPPLMTTLVFCLVLGLLYSANVPLMRWKRSPFLAAACIFGVRALAVQFGFYFHMMTTVLHREPVLSFPLLFASAFMSIFSVVIAFFKDIPDVKGDKTSSINTLSVRLGERTVLNICVALLLVAYTGAVAVGLYSPSIWCRYVLVTAHALMASSLWKAASVTDTASGASLTATYMFIWKLFYAEYCLLPLFGR